MSDRFEVLWSVEASELGPEENVLWERLSGFDDAAVASEPCDGVRVGVVEGYHGKGAAGTGVGLALEVAEHVVNDLAGLIALGVAARGLIVKVSARRGRSPQVANHLMLQALAAASTNVLNEAPDDWVAVRTVPLTTDGLSGTDLTDVWVSVFEQPAESRLCLVFMTPTTRYLGTVLVGKAWHFDGENGHDRTDEQLARLLSHAFEPSESWGGGTDSRGL
jgi:hypothetical protein